MLDIGAPAPRNARQAAELGKLPKEKQAEVMEAVDARGESSARAIQEEGARVTGQSVSKTETTERPGLDGDSWCTPDDVIAMARTVMGSIDLDPASNAHAQNVVQAGQWFSKDDDGLDKKWEAANVWVNPPYSKPLISRFAERIMVAWEREPEVEQILALVNTSSASRWWHRLANGCNSLAFRQGRVQFWHPQIPDDTPSTERDRNRYDQTLFYFGANTDVFFREVKAQGWLPMVVAP